MFQRVLCNGGTKSFNRERLWGEHMIYIVVKKSINLEKTDYCRLL